MLTDEKFRQGERLKAIYRWLIEKRSELDWLGLFEAGREAPPNSAEAQLASEVEWASTHMSMWLEGTEAVDEEEMARLNTMYANVGEWLRTHKTDRFSVVEAAISKSRDLGVAWFAEALSQRRQDIQEIIANGKQGDGHLKVANRRMRTLSELVSSSDALLAKLAIDLETYGTLRSDIGDKLDEIDKMTEDERLKGRKTFILEAGKHRNALDQVVVDLDGKPTVRKQKTSTKPNMESKESKRLPELAKVGQVEENANLLQVACKQVEGANKRLEQLQKVVGTLGTAVFENYDVLPVRQQKQLAKPTTDILINGTMKRNEVWNLFPVHIANGYTVANDVLNSPTSGWTGMTVRGTIVYHSSAGSSSVAAKGSVFWINVGNNRVLVAVGKHSAQTKDGPEYQIKWLAPGVTGSKVVLGSNDPSKQLHG